MPVKTRRLTCSASAKAPSTSPIVRLPSYPMFDPSSPEELKAKQRDKIAKRYDWVEQQLKDKDYLTGPTFTVADAYLFTVTNWAKPTGIDLSRWPALQAFMKRVAARPHVQDAMKAEGLIKPQPVAA